MKLQRRWIDSGLVMVIVLMTGSWQVRAEEPGKMAVSRKLATAVIDASKYASLQQAD